MPRHIPIFWLGAISLAGGLAGYFEATQFQFFATLVLLGFFVGFAQWLVLRHLGFEWVLLTGLGWFAGYMLTAYLPFLDTVYQALYERFGLWEVFWLNVVKTPFWMSMMLLAQCYLLLKRRQVALWFGVGLLGAVALGISSSSFCYLACDTLPNPSLATALTYAFAWLVYATVMLIPLVRLGIWRDSSKGKEALE